MLGFVFSMLILGIVGAAGLSGMMIHRERALLIFVVAWIAALIRGLLNEWRRL